MLIFSDEVLAKKLKITKRTLRRIKKKRPDFPTEKVQGVRSNAYDDVKVMDWWKGYSVDAYKEELESGVIIELSEFARKLGISRRLILNWRNNGLQIKKLGDGTVLIYTEEARRWFLNQNHPRTRAYADKLPQEGE